MDFQNDNQQRRNQMFVKQYEYLYGEENQDINSDDYAQEQCHQCNAVLTIDEVDYCEWCYLTLFGKGELTVFPGEGKVGRNDIRVSAKFGKEWINNRSKSPSQIITFTYQGNKYRGIWTRGYKRFNNKVKIHRVKMKGKENE